VWEAVSAILKDSEQLRADLDAMIKMERGSVRGDAGEEARLWADKLTEVERKRARYQEMAASDLITFDELREKLGELAETRDTAERELEAIRDRSSRLEELERDRDAVLESLVDVAPQALDSLSPEERNRFYKMLRLEVVVSPDGSLEVSGAFGDGLGICESKPLPW
jgi:DNA repair ATPase RecN